MSEIKVNTIVDASGGNTVAINGLTPTESNMAGRNLIINGDFQIDQRGYSGTTGSDGIKYTVDRWNNYFASTITKSKEIIDSRNRGILNINSSTSFGDIAQRLEDHDAFSGQTMSLSFWAKSISGSTSAKFQIGNSVDAGLVNQNFTLTTSWQKFEFSFDVPTFSNLAGTTFSYVAFQSNSANINWSISEVQLEAGSVATPFERRQYGTELALCQRYYFRNTPSGNYSNLCSLGMATGTTSIVMTGAFPVQMRSTPTVSTSNARLIDGVTGIAINSITIAWAGTYGTEITFNVTGATQYRPYYLQNNNNTAGYIDFSSEL